MSGAMSFLSQVISYDLDSKRLEAEVEIKPDQLFADNGKVPAYVAVEYMAQAVAAFAGLKAVTSDQEVKIGFLLGTRKLVLNGEYFMVGDKLSIKVEEVMTSDNGLSTFNCKLNGAACSASAMLNVFGPKDPERFIQSGGVDIE